MGDLSNQSDIDLLIRIAAQDKSAFAELFGRYGMRVKAFVLRAGTSNEDADEIAQEVLVTVWRKAHQFDPSKAAASTWIFAIARNRRIDMIRRRTRPEPDPDDPLFQPDPEPGGLEVLSAQQMATKVREGVSQLPADQRDVLKAAFYDGLSHAEIAAHFNLPLGTVKSRIRLSFKHLKTVLGDDCAGVFLDD
ncbi:MAG: sigma-70 family RNA polymerase sigma factor [Pseudomonadota bacterium]